MYQEHRKINNTNSYRASHLRAPPPGLAVTTPRAPFLQIERDVRSREIYERKKEMGT
jgi:hypothetical protein